MSNNINTLSAMISEAKRISAANKQTPAPEHVVAYHELWENAKQALSRDEQQQLWLVMRPKESGIKRFAGEKYRLDHPDAPAPMPAYIAQAQAERKAAKAAEPKAEKPATPKASKPKAEKPATPKADKPAKASKPTYTETLEAVVASLERVNQSIGELATLHAQGFAAIDKRLGAIEKRLDK